MRCKAYSADGTVCCWTETHIWSALLDFEQDDPRDVQIESVIDALDTTIDCPLEPDERAMLVDILQRAHPIMWRHRIAGPSEIERKRVQREIVKLFQPLS